MSDNKYTLLNEATVRRMMKLANIDALGNNFLNNREPMEETKKGEKITKGKTKGEKAYEYPSKGEKSKSRKGEEDYTTKKGMKKKTGRGKAYMKESDDWSMTEEEEDWGGNKGDESETHPGELDYEPDVEDVSAEEGEEEVSAEEGEVTLTDEEAQDIIALADKLRAAMDTDEGEEEVEAEVEADVDIGGEVEGVEDLEVEEEPGMRYEEVSDDLYEAALKSLDIEVVDPKRKLRLETLKKKVYKQVVSRLLRETKK